MGAIDRRQRLVAAIEDAERELAAESAKLVALKCSLSVSAIEVQSVAVEHARACLVGAQEALAAFDNDRAEQSASIDKLLNSWDE